MSYKFQKVPLTFMLVIVSQNKKKTDIYILLLG